MKIQKESIHLPLIKHSTLNMTMETLINGIIIIAVTNANCSSDLVELINSVKTKFSVSKSLDCARSNVRDFALSKRELIFSNFVRFLL